MVERPEIISSQLDLVNASERIGLAKAPGPVLGAFAFLSITFAQGENLPQYALEYFIFSTLQPAWLYVSAAVKMAQFISNVLRQTAVKRQFADGSTHALKKEELWH